MIKWFERYSWIALVISLAIAVFIFYISSLTFGSGGGNGSNLKAMTYHVFIYLLFSFFLCVALVKGKYPKLVFFALLISVIYGISDEIHQFFVPGRYLSGFDIFLDSLGTLAGALIYVVYSENASLKKKRN